ncbi:MAG: TolC family protein [Terriglobia bacterium]
MRWIGVFLASTLCAAEPLTLEHALSLAEQNHPRLQEAVARIEMAAAGIGTAKAYPNPVLDLAGGYQNARIAGAVPGSYQYYIFAQQLELPSVRQTRIQAAEINKQGSQLAQAEVLLAVKNSVRHAFFESLRWKGIIELAQQNLRLVEELRRRVQTRVEVGEAGRLELVRAEAEVATASSFANRAQLQLVSTLSALRAAIGAPPEADLDPKGTLETPQLPPIKDLREEVLNENPSLAQARAEIRRAESLLKNEQAQRKPQPLTHFEWERLPDTSVYKVGVALPLPLWNRREGPIAESQAALRRAKATADRQYVEFTAALESAYGRYQIAGQQVSAFEGGILKEAEEAVRSSEVAYQLGERGILEVLDAQRVLRTVRLDFLNAQYDRQSALTDLRYLRALDSKGTP